MTCILFVTLTILGQSKQLVVKATGKFVKSTPKEYVVDFSKDEIADWLGTIAVPKHLCEKAD